MPLPLPLPRQPRPAGPRATTWLHAGLTIVVLAALIQPANAGAAATGWRHQLTRQAGDDWSSWTLAGLRVDGGTLVLDAATAAPGEDPFGAGGYQGGSYYNGGRFVAGTAVSPEFAVSGGLDELVPSWTADTPAGTWLEVRAAVRVAGEWSPEYSLGVWAAGDDTVRRHSVRDQDDAWAKVATDTVVLKARADAYRVTVRLFAETTATSPRLTDLAVLASRRGEPAPETARPGGDAVELAVPERSQMIYPDGGPVWCSPTSTAMVMAYWGDRLGRPDLNRTVPAAAEATYDWIYRGHGNWPFNIAYAGSAGLDGFVTRLYRLDQAEAWVRAGVPVTLSLAYETGQLANSPLPRSGGHLLVVRGFTADGDAIVNDPAANPNLGQAVRRVYRRDQLERVWLAHSGGVVYLIFPPGWPAPTAEAHGAW